MNMQSRGLTGMDTCPNRSRGGRVKQPQVIVRSIAFTAASLEALEALAEKIATRTERRTSVSAVVRALLRHHQRDDELVAKLADLVEHEQRNEVVWGKQPRPR